MKDKAWKISLWSWRGLEPGKKKCDARDGCGAFLGESREHKKEEGAEPPSATIEEKGAESEDSGEEFVAADNGGGDFGVDRERGEKQGGEKRQACRYAQILEQSIDEQHNGRAQD